jgi:hypothetical protein
MINKLAKRIIKELRDTRIDVTYRQQACKFAIEYADPLTAEFVIGENGSFQLLFYQKDENLFYSFLAYSDRENFWVSTPELHHSMVQTMATFGLWVLE